MARILVTAADLSSGQLARVSVEMHGLPKRTVDRDTVLSWLRDGHSLIPSVQGKPLGSLTIVDVDGTAYVRCDGNVEAADRLPALPSV